MKGEEGGRRALRRAEARRPAYAVPNYYKVYMYLLIRPQTLLTNAHVGGVELLNGLKWMDLITYEVPKYTRTSKVPDWLGGELCPLGNVGKGERGKGKGEKQ